MQPRYHSNQILPLNLDQLQDSVHRALQLWEKTHNQESPLQHLYLFKQAFRQTNHIRRATEFVILTALDVMKDQYPASYELLQFRVLQGNTIGAVAREYSISESLAFKQQRQAIGRLTDTLYPQEMEARHKCMVSLERRLELPPQVKLFGTDEHLAKLRQAREPHQSSWLISIEGLGGLGKTALANHLLRLVSLTSDCYESVAWVSAKQQEFVPASGTQIATRPALDIDTLTHSLLNQLAPEGTTPTTPPERKALLTQLLKESAHLIVIDNLETVLDYEVLLPTLKQWANPSRFILTSRHSLRGDAEVDCFSVTVLAKEDAFDLLRHEGQVNGVPALGEASQSQLQSIYETVGGNPLALKLVVGQIRMLPLPEVLDSLKKARGKKIDELYTYIYWQAWHLLDELSQRALVAMPLANEGDYAQLSEVTQLTADELYEALEQLVTLSLIEVGGSVADRSYRIHRLTRTFLLTEVVDQWQEA